MGNLRILAELKHINITNFREKRIAAGGIVFRKCSGRILVTVLHRGKRDDFSFPKGKVESGESLGGAALREVWEEAAIEGKIVKKIGIVVYKVPIDGREMDKTVHYYLIEAIKIKDRSPDREVKSVLWMDILDESTHKLLSYSSDQQILDKAIKLLVKDSPEINNRKLVHPRIYRKTVKREVAEILKVHHLYPDHPLQDAFEKNENNYSVMCTLKNRKVFLKVNLVDLEKEKRPQSVFGNRLGTEVTLYKCFDGVVNDTSPIVTPEIIGGSTKRPSWLLLGPINNDNLIGLEEVYFPRKLRNGYIPLIGRGVASYQGMLDKFPGLQSRLFKYTSNAIERWFDSYTQEAWPYLGDELSSEVRNFLFSDDSERVWDNHCFALTHGDLSFSNFGIENGKLLVIDWENVQINNPAYDYARIYTQTLRQSKWRKKLVKYLVDLYGREEEFLLLLRMAVVMRCVATIRNLALSISYENLAYSRWEFLKQKYSRTEMLDLFWSDIKGHIETIRQCLEERGDFGRG